MNSTTPRWLLNVLYVKVVYVSRLTHEYSYRNMQLSVQAADRQRKNILQMSLRFHQRAQQMVAETWQHLENPVMSKSLPVLPASGQIEDTPELFGPNKEDPMDAAFREYNCFGLAEQTDQYKLAEKDCQAMKAADCRASYS